MSFLSTPLSCGHFFYNWCHWKGLLGSFCSFNFSEDSYAMSWVFRMGKEFRSAVFLCGRKEEEAYWQGGGGVYCIRFRIYPKWSKYGTTSYLGLYKNEFSSFLIKMYKCITCELVIFYTKIFKYIHFLNLT